MKIKIAGWIGRVAYLGGGVKEAFYEKITAESGMTRVQMFEKKSIPHRRNHQHKVPEVR